MEEIRIDGDLDDSVSAALGRIEDPEPLKGLNKPAPKEDSIGAALQESVAMWQGFTRDMHKARKTFVSNIEKTVHYFEDLERSNVETFRKLTGQTVREQPRGRFIL